jgi:7-cyano-7-deazaguanine synthase in queuosine biosynthesis
METALHLCDWVDLTLHASYLHLSKADIVKIGINLGVDYALTWTCYKGEARPCGKCGACVERMEAFREAGVRDPGDSKFLRLYIHNFIKCRRSILTIGNVCKSLHRK